MNLALSLYSIHPIHPPDVGSLETGSQTNTRAVLSPPSSQTSIQPSIFSFSLLFWFLAVHSFIRFTHTRFERPTSSGPLHQPIMRSRPPSDETIEIKDLRENFPEPPAAIDQHSVQGRPPLRPPRDLTDWGSTGWASSTHTLANSPYESRSASPAWNEGSTTQLTSGYPRSYQHSPAGPSPFVSPFDSRPSSFIVRFQTQCF